MAVNPEYAAIMLWVILHSLRLKGCESDQSNYENAPGASTNL
jgi:hypothetical protein